MPYWLAFYVNDYITYMKSCQYINEMFLRKSLLFVNCTLCERSDLMRQGCGSSTMIPQGYLLRSNRSRGNPCKYPKQEKTVCTYLYLWVQTETALIYWVFRSICTFVPNFVIHRKFSTPLRARVGVLFTRYKVTKLQIQ